MPSASACAISAAVRGDAGNPKRSSASGKCNAKGGSYASCPPAATGPIV
jgi:hypothetical protein